MYLGVIARLYMVAGLVIHDYQLNVLHGFSDEPT